jgi:hypothetical protein
MTGKGDGSAMLARFWSFAPPAYDFGYLQLQR